MSTSIQSGFVNENADLGIGRHAAALHDCEDSKIASFREGWGSPVVRFLADEDGATAVEYAVMVSLIAATCIAGFQALTTATLESFQTSADELSE